jgi:hypothetical protein
VGGQSQLDSLLLGLSHHGSTMTMVGYGGDPEAISVSSSDVVIWAAFNAHVHLESIDITIRGSAGISPALVNADSVVTAEDCTLDAGNSEGYCLLAHGLTRLDRCTLKLSVGLSVHVINTKETLAGGVRGLFRFRNNTFRGDVSVENEFGIFFDVCSQEDENGV